MVVPLGDPSCNCPGCRAYRARSASREERIRGSKNNLQDTHVELPDPATSKQDTVLIYDAPSPYWTNLNVGGKVLPVIIQPAIRATMLVRACREYASFEWKPLFISAFYPIIPGKVPRRYPVSEIRDPGYLEYIEQLRLSIREEPRPFMLHEVEGMIGRTRVLVRYEAVPIFHRIYGWADPEEHELHDGLRIARS